MSAEQTKTSPCRILFRSKRNVELYTVDEKPTETSKKSITLAKGLSTIHSFSPDGRKLIVHLKASGVRLFDLEKLKYDEEVSSSICLENSERVQYMSFSSQGSFIITWERSQKPTEDDTNPTPNLKIWSADTGLFIHGFPMKNMRKFQWPPLRWTFDEKYAFFLVTNEIHVYNGHDFLEDEVRYVDRIKCKGLTTFSVPTSSYLQNNGNYLIISFNSEVKGKPARISLLRYPDKIGDSENPKSGPPLASKSFYQAEECNVRWSPRGDSALILTTTSVDTTGGSYYGSSNLFLLLSESKSSLGGEALSVPLPGPSGPVLDASWMPNPNRPPAFCVISGRMPALASLHNGSTAEATFLFGNSHRNTIVWSNHGRFIVLGGFGNLAGGMDFYDINKLKKIPQYDPASGADLGTFGNTASCAVGNGWSPTSRFFMVSTTTPRMNVDNGVRLYKYNGLEVTDESIVSWDNSKYSPDLLLAAEFVPAHFNEYPDRPQTPPPKTSEYHETVIKKSKPTVSAQAAYVPPGARKSGGLSLAERMRKEKETSNVGAMKLNSTGGINTSIFGKKMPVGMTSVESGKSKNALRKERQRLAKQKAELAQKEELERKEREEKQRQEEAAKDPKKRAKKLNKILKQIQELKLKDPALLNQDQVKKLDSEDEILKELSELSLSDKSII